VSLRGVGCEVQGRGVEEFWGFVWGLGWVELRMSRGSGGSGGSSTSSVVKLHTTHHPSREENEDGDNGVFHSRTGRCVVLKDGEEWGASFL
jgi:hypothetical protein